MPKARVLSFLPIILTVILLSCYDAFCEEMNPEEIVKSYCMADLDGIRLSGETYPTVAPMVAWKAEAAWDLAFVTSSISITKTIKLDEKTMLIQVQYKNMGIITGDILIETHFTEVLDITLLSRNGQWKINGPNFPPHVSPKALSDHYKKLADIEENRSNVLKGLSERLVQMTSLLEK